MLTQAKFSNFYPQENPCRYPKKNLEVPGLKLRTPSKEFCSLGREKGATKHPRSSRRTYLVKGKYVFMVAVVGQVSVLDTPIRHRLLGRRQLFGAEHLVPLLLLQLVKGALQSFVQ